MLELLFNGAPIAHKNKIVINNNNVSFNGNIQAINKAQFIEERTTTGLDGLI